MCVSARASMIKHTTHVCQLCVCVCASQFQRYRMWLSSRAVTVLRNAGSNACKTGKLGLCVDTLRGEILKLINTSNGESLACPLSQIVCVCVCVCVYFSYAHSWSQICVWCSATATCTHADLTRRICACKKKELLDEVQQLTARSSQKQKSDTMSDTARAAMFSGVCARERERERERERGK